MVTNVGRVGVEVVGDNDNFKRKMRETENVAARGNRRIAQSFTLSEAAAKRLDRAVKRAATRMGQFGAAIAAVGTVGAVAVFAKLEQQMAEVRA